MILSEVLDGLLAFGRVVASRAASRSRAVLVDLRGDRARDGTEETHDSQTMWLASPLLYRPAPPNGAGGEEALFVRRGNEAVVIGTRDMRWQVELAEGECVIRALGTNAARVRLTPTGSIVLEGTVEIRDASGTVTTGLTREDAVRAELSAIAATLASGSNGAGAVVWAVPYLTTRPAGADLKSKRISVDK